MQKFVFCHLREKKGAECCEKLKFNFNMEGKKKQMVLGFRSRGYSKLIKVGGNQQTMLAKSIADFVLVFIFFN